jgi:hypothetical protein
VSTIQTTGVPRSETNPSSLGSSYSPRHRAAVVFCGVGVSYERGALYHAHTHTLTLSHSHTRTLALSLWQVYQTRCWKEKGRRWRYSAARSL